MSSNQSNSSNIIWTNDIVSQTDFLVFREAASQVVTNVVAPNGLQVGLYDENFVADLNVTGHMTGSGNFLLLGSAITTGSIEARLGLTGSLQKLTDGSNFLQAGSNVTITNNPDGSISIASAVALAGAVTAGSGLSFTGGGTFDGSVAKTLNVDIAGQTEVSAAAGDYVLIVDADDSNNIKKTLVSSIQGSGASIDIASLALMTEGDLVSGDSLAINDTDAGAVKKITVEDFGQYLALGTNSGIGESSGQLTIDIHDLADATIDPAADYIAFSDEDVADDPTKKQSVALFIDAIRGTTTATGLNSTAGILSVDIPTQVHVSPESADYVLIVDTSDTNALKRTTVGDIQSLSLSLDSLSSATVDVATDSIGIIDFNDSNNSKKDTIANLMTTVAGDGLSSTSGVLAVSVDDSTIETDSDALRVKDGGISNAKLANSSLTVTAGDGLKNAGSVALGSSITMDIDVSDFAGTGLEDDGSENLRIASSAVGAGLTGGGGSAIAVDFGSSSGKVAAGSNTATIISGHGLSGGGSVNAIGSSYSVSLDVVPADFAGKGTSISSNQLHSYLQAGSNITITTGSEDQFVINSSLSVGYTAGDGLDLNGYEFSLDLKSGTGLKIDPSDNELTFDSTVISGTGMSVLSNIMSSYIAAGANVTITTGSEGQFVIASQTSGTITGVTAGTGIAGGGNSGTVTLDLDASELSALGTTVANEDYIIIEDVTDNSTKKVLVSNLPQLQNVFTNVAVSGQDNISADATTDTLTLAAGPNITITTDASNDTVTIEAAIDTYTAGNGLDLTSTEFSVDLKSSGGLKIVDTELAIEPADFKGTGLSESSDTLSAYLSAGSNVTVTTGSEGELIIAASASGNAFQTISVSGQDDVVADGITDTLTLVAGDNITITTDAESDAITIASSTSAQIGAAEDADYTDGLFTDFTTSTPTGTAIDRFNEVLKGLAPAAAPQLDDIGCNDTGVSAKLSFGNSQSISGYTNARPSTLTPANSLSDIDINSAYSSTSDSNHLRKACFGTDRVIDGKLNDDVSADGVNYVGDSFGDANQGTLKLYVNDNTTPIHTTDLSSFGSGNSLNSNGSGFNLSAATPGHFADSSNFATFQHRQGTYTIAAGVGVSDDQRNGWNWSRVVHTVGGSDRLCNYVEWVNDTIGAGVAMSVSGDSLGSLSMTGTKNLSGVKYHTGGTAAYAITIANAYRNVRSSSQITFGGSNTSVPAQNIPDINHGAGEDETKSIVLSGLTATIDNTENSILNGSISVNTNVPHPLKTPLAEAGNQSISGILLYTISEEANAETFKISENFAGESKRMKNHAYNAQADVSVGNTWDSTDSLLSVDGMLVYNQTLVAPKRGANSGNFAGITNCHAGNFNYNGITGTRTFFRKFTNNQGGSKTNFDLTLNGSGTIVASGGTLNSSNIKVFCKLPNNGSFSTGWMDLATSFATGQVADDAGCLVGSLDSSLSATNEVTFGTQSVGSDEYIVIKVLADGSWTGNISQISISWL